MNKPNRCRWSLLALMGCLSMALISPAHADEGSFKAPSEITYITKQHDTLIDLARRYFNRVEDYRVVQDLNHVPVPEHLQPRVNLRIPVILLRGEPVPATVLSYRGDVRVGDDRRMAAPNMPLNEGARLETGAGAFVTIRVADGSIVTMPSQSVMRLTRMRRILLTGSLDQEFTVERGRVETTVAKQVGAGSRYEIRTPIAVSAVRGTVFRVAYGDGPSFTEVLNGTVAVAGKGVAEPLPVPVGVGAAVGRSGGIETEKLLPPPSLSPANQIQAGHDLHFSLARVDGATGYHLQIARDERFHDILSETTAPGPDVTMPAIDNGAWFLRVTAISAKGFEGLPAMQGFNRIARALDASVTRTGGHEYRFAWRYSGEPDVHYRFQLEPLRHSRHAFALNHDHFAATVLVLDDVPPGAYRWRVGAIRGSDELWTAWQDIGIERAGN